MPYGRKIVKRHDHAVAFLRDVGTDLEDFAHRLVAKHVSLFHRRDDAVENVEVGAANRARRNLDNRVARVLDTRIVNRVAADNPFAVPAVSIRPAENGLEIEIVGEIAKMVELGLGAIAKQANLNQGLA